MERRPSLLDIKTCEVHTGRMKALRWVLFIPGAMAAALVAQFIAALSQFVLAAWLAQCTVNFWMAGAFVAAGSAIAPTHHPAVRISLLTVQILSVIAGLFLVSDLASYAALMAQALGAVSGFFAAKANHELNAELP